MADSSSSSSSMPSSGRTVLMASAVGFTGIQAVRLTWNLFQEYVASPTFQGDVADALFSYESLYSFFESGFQPSVLATMYARVLGNRMTYRLTECAVSACCAFSPSPFFQGAVVFHYLYPTVQEYRFGRSWVTRAVRLAASWLVPRFLRPAKIDAAVDPDGAYLQNPPHPLSFQSGGSGGGGGAAFTPGGAARNSHAGERLLGNAEAAANRGKVLDADAAFYERAEAVFDAMPEVCGATLRYYVYSYKASPFRTILQAAFIPDVARCLVDLAQWGAIFAEERGKATSWGRLLKRFVADQIGTAAQLALSYAVRYMGARAAMALFSEPTGGAIFWTEHIVHFALGFQVLLASMYVRVRLYDALESRFPPTSEDVEEDRREQAEAEEEQTRSDAWTRMASDGLRGGDGDGGSGGASITSGGMINFYAVLEVDDRTSAAEIKKAYRQLALKNHPDRAAGDEAAQRTARERMAVINEAYDTLIDGRKRAQYDARRRMAAAPNVVERLDNMSGPKLLGVTAGAVALVGVAGYAHFVATFQRVTACGAGPLLVFSGGI